MNQSPEQPVPPGAASDEPSRPPGPPVQPQDPSPSAEQADPVADPPGGDQPLALDYQPAVPPSLTRQTLTGVRLVAATGILTKALSLISTVVLGWLLLPADYGIFAAAYSLVTVVALLRDAGATRFLIQRYDEYERLARPMLELALIANLLGAAILVGGGLLLEREHPGVTRLALVLGIAIVMRTPVVIWRARLQGQMQFPVLARLDVISLLIQYSTTILLAWLGFGAMSLALPGIAVAAWEIVRLWALVGPAPGGHLAWARFREIFATAKWVMLTTAGIALIINGDYLALALLKSSEELGSYFFGFQLSVAVAAIFATSLEGVLLPAFARARDDRQRLARAYRRAISLSAVLIGAIAVGAAVVAPSAVHQIWRGRWEDAIPVAVIMFISLAMRGQASACAGLLEAMGRWRLRVLLVIIEGLGMFTAAAVGAMLGGILTVAIVVGAFRIVSGFALSQIGGRLAGVGFTELLMDTLAPVVVALACAGAAWGTWHLLDIPPRSLVGGATGASVYTLAWLSLSLLFQRRRVLEAFGALLGRG